MIFPSTVLELKARNDGRKAKKAMDSNVNPKGYSPYWLIVPVALLCVLSVGWLVHQDQQRQEDINAEISQLAADLSKVQMRVDKLDLGSKKAAALAHLKQAQGCLKAAQAWNDAENAGDNRDRYCPQLLAWAKAEIEQASKAAQTDGGNPSNAQSKAQSGQPPTAKVPRISTVFVQNLRLEKLIGAVGGDLSDLGQSPTPRLRLAPTRQLQELEDQYELLTHLHRRNQLLRRLLETVGGKVEDVERVNLPEIEKSTSDPLQVLHIGIAKELEATHIMMERLQETERLEALILG